MHKLSGPGPRVAAGGAKVAKRKTKKVFKGPPGAREPATTDKYYSGGSDEDDHSDSEDEGTEDYKKGGYHPVRMGEKYNDGRYVVQRKLGWGHFSTVWLVLDTTTGQQAALKVQKSASHYTEAARDEITLLAQIRDGDPSNECHCVRVLDWFEHSGPNGRHMCMVFEVLGDNLLTLIKHYNYRGIPIPFIRKLTREVLIGLDYLHTKCKIIHTDLKPENVMLSQPIRRKHLPAAPAAASEAAATTAAGLQPPVSAAGSDPGQLTKNQKKKAKRKAKKGGTGSEAGDEAAAPPTSDDSTRTGLETESQGRGDREASVSAPATDAAAADPAAAGGGVRAGGGTTADGGVAGSSEGAASGSSQEVDAAVEDEGQAAERFEEQLMRMSAKIVDFGNACWTNKHFTDDIQTRQYRSPEVILGAKYDTSADIWSLACVVFELVTGDLLFDPRSGKDYDRDEDHLALMIELLGRMPRKVSSAGKFARDYFNRHGELRHIKKLKFWPLERVLTEKYALPEAEAKGLASFLEPMLDFVPEKRAQASAMLSHPWLRGELPDVAPRDGAGGAHQKRYRQRKGRSGSRTRSPQEEQARKRSRSPSPNRHASGQQLPPPPPVPLLAAVQQQQQALVAPPAAPPVDKLCDSLHGSCVLLSPTSSCHEAGLTASTVIVSKMDAASLSGASTPKGGASKPRISLDSSVTDADGWQLL